MPANMENSAVATGLEKVSFHSNPKERQCQRIFKHTIALISHATNVMLKILQARLQQYVNPELPGIQARFRKGRGTRDQIDTICWIIEKARVSEKHLLCVDHRKLRKIQEMGILDHLACFQRNLYEGQEATVRTRHGISDWLQIGKGVHKGCILSPCLFNLCCFCC